MGVLTPNLVAVEQRWTSPRLTRWFVGIYCTWILLGSIWSWYRYCDVNGAASAHVVFIHTRSERVRAYGDVTIHQYIGDPHELRFVGDTRLQVTTEHPRSLKLSLMFDNVHEDGQMTVRRRPGAVERTVDSLFCHSVTFLVPLPVGDHGVELLFNQKDIQYMMSTVELVKNGADVEARQQEIAIERNWMPFFERGGVQISIGSGWFLPLPDLAAERPFSHTGRQAYLLLTAEKPGDYELVLPWMRADRSYREPSVLVDGKECPMEVTSGAHVVSHAKVRLRLEKEHVLSIKLRDKIVSPLSQWADRDERFLGYQVSWNTLEMHRKE